MSRCRILLPLACVALALPLCAARGQGPDAFAGDLATGYVWSLLDTTGTVLNGADPYTQITGLALDADGQILVADLFEGVSRLDPATGDVTAIEPDAVDAVDLYPDSQSPDVFYITDGNQRQLCVLPGGTAPGTPCMDFGPSPLDIQVRPSGPAAGNVIILFGLGLLQEPPYLAEFHRTGPTTFEELTPIVPEAPAGSKGFAIDPDGGIVLLDQGAGMYHVLPDTLVHFGPTTGLYGERIDIGADGTIYVADTEMNLIQRFTPAGEWILPGMGDAMQFPKALAAVGYTPSHPGQNVPVTPIEGVNIVFEQVAGGGYTSAFTTTTPNRVSPGGNTLPDYAVAPAGGTTFTYIDITTTAAYENLIQIDVLLPGSRQFWAHGTGQVFQDATVEGSLEDARGVISRFSEVVLVDDDRSPVEVVSHKFARLFQILEPQVGDPPELVAVKEALTGRAAYAMDLYAGGLYLNAIAELTAMNGVVREHAGVEIPNSPGHPLGNLAGEMLSRSKTLIFSLWPFAHGAGVPGDEAEGGTAGLSLTCASPARGQCRFELSGPDGATVVAKLYTVSGRLVRTLFDGRLEGGRSSVVWDGTDADGLAVASGVYVTRVESADDVVCGRVVFIR